MNGEKFSDSLTVLCTASFFLHQTQQLHSFGLTPTPTVLAMGLLFLCWFHMWLHGLHLDPVKYKHKHNGETFIHYSRLLLFAQVFLPTGIAP